MLLFLLRRYLLAALTSILLFIALPLSLGARFWPTLAVGITLAAPTASAITW